MLNGERKSFQIEVSRSTSAKYKSVTELLNNYNPELVEGPKPLNHQPLTINQLSFNPKILWKKNHPKRLPAAKKIS